MVARLSSDRFAARGFCLTDALRRRGDLGRNVLKAAPPPPGTVVRILRAGVVGPVGRIGRNELDAGMEADERHILNRDLHETIDKSVRESSLSRAFSGFGFPVIRS